jgi:hypothetical protein
MAWRVPKAGRTHSRPLFWPLRVDPVLQVFRELFRLKTEAGQFYREAGNDGSYIAYSGWLGPFRCFAS